MVDVVAVGGSLEFVFCRLCIVACVDYEDEWYASMATSHMVGAVVLAKVACFGGK